MARSFRVIDTGLRDGRMQIAFDQAMIEAHKSGEIPDTVRFLRFPPTALVGRHQKLSQEIKLDYCRANGIGTARRITGGGAIYFDEGQLGWELVFHRETLGLASLAELAKVICEAAAAGLCNLGIDARYRPRNDIEVDGRKISGTGGFFDGNTLFYQGTVLADMNPADMLAALNVPQAKFARRELDSAAQRVVTLKELLGEVPDMDAIKAALLDGFSKHLGIVAEPGEITDYEERRARELFDDEIGTDEFVAEIDEPAGEAGVLSAVHAGAGGTVNANVRLEGPAMDRFREVLLSGDFFVTPPRVVLDLEAYLRGRRAADCRTDVQKFFAQADVGLLSITPDDFAAAIEGALASAK